MRLSAIGGQAFITGFSGAAMPGPVLAATIVLSTAHGFLAGPAIVFGHFLVEAILVLLLAAGLYRLISRPDAPLVRGIALVGGVVLMLMGGDMARSLPGLSLAAAQRGEVGYSPVLAGVVFTAVTPYFWLWWATIGLGLLTESVARRGKAGLAAFYTGHILADLVWYSLVSGLIAFGAGLLTDGVYRGLIGVCAAMLLVFGAKFVAVGLRPARAEQPQRRGDAEV